MKGSGFLRELFLEVLLVPLSLAVASSVAQPAADIWHAASRCAQSDWRAAVRDKTESLVRQYCPCAPQEQRDARASRPGEQGGQNANRLFR